MMCLSLTQSEQHVSGFLTVLEPEGSTSKASNMPVTGDVDGQDVTIRAERFLSMGNVTFTGHLSGDRLTLSAPTSNAVVSFELHRQRIERFNASVAEWQNELAAQEAARERARAEQQARRSRFEAAQSTFDDWAEVGRRLERMIADVKIEPSLATGIDDSNRSFQDVTRARRKVDEVAKTGECDSASTALVEFRDAVVRMNDAHIRMVDSTSEAEATAADFRRTAGALFASCQDYASVTSVQDAEMVRLKTNQLVQSARLKVAALDVAIARYKQVDQANLARVSEMQTGARQQVDRLHCN